jgi:hypothetical protein
MALQCRTNDNNHTENHAIDKHGIAKYAMDKNVIDKHGTLQVNWPIETLFWSCRDTYSAFT